MTVETEPVEISDIVQVMDKDHPAFACLLVVAEIRPDSKGVWAYNPQRIWPPECIPLDYDEFVVVGKAVIVAAEFDDDPEVTDENAGEEERVHVKRSTLN